LILIDAVSVSQRVSALLSLFVLFRVLCLLFKSRDCSNA
jgi:hypothetical protein